MIREANFSDAERIAEIYNYYILHTVFTFEVEPITPQEITMRMKKSQQMGPYLVYEEDGDVIGYTYVSTFPERKAYEHSVESTIYLKHGFGGKGIGKSCMQNCFCKLPPNAMPLLEE